MALKTLLLISAQIIAVSTAFAPAHYGRHVHSLQTARRSESSLKSTEEKAAPMVTGEELELMMTDWDEPLVVDAFATWCGPCLLMSPEFEAAAKELKGKVRFVKIDTDEEEEMAARLNIMGLPTLLFLGKFEPKDGQDEQAKAVLKLRIEGALKKESILELCEHHFFGGPTPELP